jgi:uncharacterized protein YbjT (DUF2867 family)
MILVAGATGLVGSAICEILAARGERIRALVRTSSSSEKIGRLRSLGVDLVSGDLKDAGSLAVACHGATAVISTASSTLSRQPGDSIESVDAAGHMSLVNAAKAAGIGRFVFVSFRRPAGMSFPLGEAKAAVERAIADISYTVIQASWFMEVWLSPGLGFDYVNAAARIYGAGTNPISWVSFRNVAEMCALAVRNPAAERRTIEFGGPEALSPIEVVARFEKLGGRPFRLEHISEAALRAQFEQATDPMQKSFAALMLGYANGDAMDTGPIAGEFGIRLASVDEHARKVLATGTAA